MMYQYHNSAILIENNGKKSLSKSTIHINTRYFLIIEHINQCELEIKYCITEDILGDYFTKPLQGKLFIKFHKSVMNPTKYTD